MAFAMQHVKADDRTLSPYVGNGPTTFALFARNDLSSSCKHCAVVLKYFRWSTAPDVAYQDE